ncbi:MAG: prolyl oligopeptidase family serine peptidase [Pseudomonadota bacterium]
MFRRLICLVMASLALDIWARADTPHGMNAVDFVEMPRLSQPALSPDGQTFAWLESETDWTENKIIRHLRVIDTKTGESRPTPDFKGQNSRIWWHPDSQGYVYLDTKAEEEKAQAWFLDLTTGDTRQLTTHGESVRQVIWHPNGSGFFFAAAEVQPSSDTQMFDAGWLIPPYGAQADAEVWWYEFASGETQRLVHGLFSALDVSVSRSGQHLVTSLAPDHALDSRHLADVFVRTLGEDETRRWTLNRFAERTPRLSPDATRLAYLASVNPDGEPYYDAKVFVETLNGRRQRLLADRDMEALAFAWDATGDGLFILGNTGVRSNLYHYDLGRKTLRQLTDGDHAIQDWVYDPIADTHIARFETMSGPGEYQIMRDETAGFVPLTKTYTEWSRQFDLPRQDVVRWRGRRGVQLEGLLVYPLGYEPGQTYPLVTITHGGPRNSAKFGSWNVSRYLPVLSAQGYLVFLPNHRGGTGYGDRFVRDMVGGYFRNAHHDVMDGIDKLIEDGLADPDQLIKMGWSAGGHMVNKLITHTERFAAASSGAGASDWLSMHGESDVRHGREAVFGGTPWQRAAPRRRYRQDSPLREVWKVTTPTLFFVGEKDVRVPPTQSILMYRGVQATGTPTVLYQAEGEPHNFRKPANQLFKINTELSWFARFARGESYEPVLPDAAFAAPDPIMEAALEAASSP